MAPEPRNVYLDADESDEEENQSYDSDAEDLRKGGRGDSRSAKRRKLKEESDEDEDDFADSDDDLEQEKLRKKPIRTEEENTKSEKKGKGKRKAEADEDAGVEEAEERGKPSKKRKKTLFAHGKDSDVPGHLLLQKNLVVTDKAVQRSGVVYLSRVPPYMKPSKLRSLLAPYGQLNRLFLAPEDPQAHTRRVRGGGNKKRSFTDGWVEFVRKADAKRAVELLNTQTIGGRKSGNYYRDDMWNMVYLRGFKWNDLTKQIATENAERASRMRAEIAQTRRENEEFVRNVEHSKMLKTIEAKAEARADKAEADKPEADKEPAPKSKTALSFQQRKLVTKTHDNDGDGAQPERLQRVLSKIF